MSDNVVPSSNDTGSDDYAMGRKKFTPVDVVVSSGDGIEMSELVPLSIPDALPIRKLVRAANNVLNDGKTSSHTELRQAVANAEQWLDEYYPGWHYAEWD